MFQSCDSHLGGFSSTLDGMGVGEGVGVAVGPGVGVGVSVGEGVGVGVANAVGVAASVSATAASTGVGGAGATGSNAIRNDVRAASSRQANRLCIGGRKYNAANKIRALNTPNP